MHCFLQYKTSSNPNPNPAATLMNQHVAIFFFLILSSVFQSLLVKALRDAVHIFIFPSPRKRHCLCFRFFFFFLLGNSGCGVIL